MVARHIPAVPFCTRFRLAVGLARVADSKPAEDLTMTVIVVMGVAGSGKTTVGSFGTSDLTMLTAGAARPGPAFSVQHDPLLHGGYTSAKLSCAACSISGSGPKRTRITHPNAPNDNGAGVGRRTLLGAERTRLDPKCSARFSHSILLAHFWMDFSRFALRIFQAKATHGNRLCTFDLGPRN